MAVDCSWVEISICDVTDVLDNSGLTAAVDHVTEAVAVAVVAVVVGSDVFGGEEVVVFGVQRNALWAIAAGLYVCWERTEGDNSTKQPDMSNLFNVII